MGGNVRDHHSLIHRSVKPHGLAPPGKKYGTALDSADPCASNNGSIASTNRPMAATTSDYEYSGNGLYLDDQKYTHHDTAGSASSAKVSSSLASRKQRHYPARRRRGNPLSEPVVLCKILGWGFVLGLAFFAVTTYRETNTRTETETETEPHPAETSRRFSALFDTEPIAGLKRIRMPKGSGHADSNERARRRGHPQDQYRERIARQKRRKKAAEWQEPEATFRTFGTPTDDGAYGDDALARVKMANAQKRRDQEQSERSGNANSNSNSNSNRNRNSYRNSNSNGNSNSNDGVDSTHPPSERDPHELLKRRLSELHELEKRMVSNTNTTVRWADMSDVPALPGQHKRSGLLYSSSKKRHRSVMPDKSQNKQFYQVHRSAKTQMAWEKEFAAIEDKDATARPDYVNYVEHQYTYPEKMMEPPTLGEYPRLRPYSEVLGEWPQDELDNPPPVLHEYLLHFDWNDPEDMEAAVKFRTAKLPFKVINVPEVLAATEKWTDDYIAEQFDTRDSGWMRSAASKINRSNGRCNEGPDNFFAFFNTPLWDVMTLGLPPTRDNDWTFQRWAQHARYADRVGLDPNLPHYYWQSGVPREERYSSRSKWTFVSRDLPSFSSTEANFIQWKPDAQKGIQCRFGERGITAANHYDSGRNMIAMITGAKRYILSPPRACKRLGIVSSKGHSSFRHSMLNYGHINLLDSRPDMPAEERAWMERVGTAEAVSTVLKEGEILYVPTGWFHYITSLQKSAQCNVRSGPDMSGDAFFGGANEIRDQCFPHDD